MQERFFEPSRFAVFCEEFTAELTRLRREHLAQMVGARRELATVERRQQEIMKLVLDGYRSEAWNAELQALDARKAGFTAALAEPTLPALHPQMAEIFRRKATTLAAALEGPDERDTAPSPSRFPRSDRDSSRGRAAAGRGKCRGHAGGGTKPESTGKIAVGKGACGGAQPAEFGVRLDGGLS
jgi:hypothetical protein